MHRRGPAHPAAASPAASAADTLLAAMKRAGARRAAAAGEVARITGAPRDALYARWDEV